MISETRAKQLINQADNLRQKSPQQASELYLQAAEMYLRLSEILNNPKFLTKAEDTFKKSQSLQNTNQFQENRLNVESLLMEKPKLTFKDVAGLKDLKEEIWLKVIAPLKFPKIYHLFKKNVGGGILMYGPPGCGKSLIAEATAGEANVAFFHVKASDLKSKYVGETERNIAKLFETARDHQPCIIFFDEFEALGEERSNASPQNRGAVSQLLTEINGVGTKGDQILVLAATNEPWAVDLALRREGRFGTTLFVPPPDQEAREQILSLHLKDRPTDELDLQEISCLTKNYSGADLTAVVNNAVEQTIKDCITQKTLRFISQEDLLNGVKTKKSSIIPWFGQAVQKVHMFQLQDSFPELLEYGEELVMV